MIEQMRIANLAESTQYSYPNGFPLMTEVPIERRFYRSPAER